MSDLKVDYGILQETEKTLNTLHTEFSNCQAQERVCDSDWGSGAVEVSLGHPASHKHPASSASPSSLRQSSGFAVPASPSVPPTPAVTWPERSWSVWGRRRRKRSKIIGTDKSRLETAATWRLRSGTGP
jgi:hypothetical protein